MTDTVPQEELDLNFHTDMPVGEILRRTRTHYGQSLFQVEGILRIRASQLEALETGDIAKLPGRVYAIGFVRSYSEYLGLDGDKMVHLFKEQSVGKQKKPELSFPVPASESKVPSLKVIGGSIAGVIVLIGLMSYMMFPRSDKTQIPAVPDQLTKSQLNEAPSLVVQQPSPMATAAAQQQAQTQPAPSVAGTNTATATLEPPKASNRINLQIVESSWIEIKNKDGAAILRQVLKPGDIYLVPNEPGMTMSTGNAGGIKIIVDGKETPSLGVTGQIKRRIALDPDSLARTLSPSAAPVAPPTTQAQTPPASNVQTDQ